MMFVSAYPVCSPALPVSYWAEAAVAAASTNPRVFEQHPGHRRHQQHPTTNAFSGDAVKRPSSFYISDILYPSVIPLPGTLPHGSNSSSPCDAESPLSSPDRQTGDSRGATSLVATSVATKMVKSSDLKFGIDRILADDVKSKDGHPVGGLDKKTVTPKPTLAAPTPVISYCPCSTPPPTSYGMVYTPLSYSSAHVSHPLVQIQHAAHPAARPPTTVSGGYHQMSRQSDFPGPYAALASDSHQPQQQQPKRKRSWSRAVFSNLQRKGLEKRFEVQKYVTKPDRRQLAAMLGLTDAQVKVWFQNRRMKWRHAEDAKRKRDEDETCKGDGTDSEKENGMTVECVDSVIKMNDLQHADLQDVVNGEIVNGDNTMQTSDSESDSEHEMMLDS